MISYLVTNYLELRNLAAFILFFVASHAYGQCQVTASTDTLWACDGGSITYAATGGSNYEWSGMSSMSCVNCSTGTATVTRNDTLIVKSTTTVNQLAVNGDFSQGNTGFGSAYTYNPNTIWNEGTYAVGTNPNAVHPNFGTWGDHTTGNGNYMLVNGSTSGAANLWTQNVAFPPNVTVTMRWWTLTFVTPPGSLRLRVNGTIIGANAPTPNVAGVWQSTTRTFTSSPSGNNLIALQTVSSALAGNDFGLDDISYAYSCEAYDTIYVQVRPNPTVSIDSVVETGGCDELCVNWLPASTIDTTAGMWVWDFGDGSPLDTSFSPNHCYSSPGSYTPSVMATNEHGCSATAVLNPVFVGQTPTWMDLIPQVAGGYWDGNVFIIPSVNPSISVIGNLTQYMDVDSLFIDWGDGNSDYSGPYFNTNAVTGQHDYSSNTTRARICFEAYNPVSCFDEICIDVVFTPFIEIPNVFSPNNDGRNDVFLPDFRGAETVRWTVFNRWGRVVYDSESATEGWDGTVNGRPVAEGVYFITAIANGAAGQEPYKLQGSVHVFH